MSEDWPQAIQYFETAIQAFLKSLDRCRLSCEKPFDQGWFPDFVSSVASKCLFLCEVVNVLSKFLKEHGNIVI